jgi:tetratricopeptide (TPR) repeat protein
VKLFGSILVLLLICGAATAQQHESQSSAKPVTLMPGLGNLHHPVTTSNPQAQEFFDQGLRLIYAFNHEEAARSFQHAAELDPSLAMAYWGVAESLGPNYNDPDSDDARFQQAYQSIQKAVALAPKATLGEQAYIQAMAQRFPADPKADRRKAGEIYRDSMREVVKRFPDDLDAATLFAESSMDLNAWALWHSDGTAAPGTDEIIATLESVIRRDPNHMGAVHYYIHAVEASPNPERALAGANRLASLAPAAGHLVHMPAHIYVRTGDFDAAVKTNQQAAAADRAYIQASGAQGVYPLMYYSHNLHFIAMAASMDGDYVAASGASAMLAAHVGPAVKNMPPLESFMIVPIAVEIRFHKWDKILQLPQPDPAMKAATFYWHFARGMALAGEGKTAEAEAEYKIVADTERQTSPDEIFDPPVNNKVKDIRKIAENILAGKIALAKHDAASAAARLSEAIAVQDSLNYSEPPDWFFPVRESLGAVLLRSGKAADAEKVFRADLARNPRNPRSLFGLCEALKAQNETYDAQFVDKEFQAAWEGTDTVALSATFTPTDITNYSTDTASGAWTVKKLRLDDLM